MIDTLLCRGYRADKTKSFPPKSSEYIVLQGFGFYGFFFNWEFYNRTSCFVKIRTFEIRLLFATVIISLKQDKMHRMNYWSAY